MRATISNSRSFFWKVLWTALPVIFLLAFAAERDWPRESPAIAKAGNPPQGRAAAGAVPRGQWSIPPFHIFGALYYVGMSDNTSFLFHTAQGDILLDPLAEGPADEVRHNIETLGFNLKDVKIILQSHAHSDHIAGLAKFKEWTGAKVLVMAEDAPAVEDGGLSSYNNTRGVPGWKGVHPDGLLHDGEKVKLGDVTMVAHLTPAHTKGCTSWSTVLEEGGKKLNTVFICSMRINTGIPILRNAKYPNMPQDWERGFKTLRSLKADMFFVSHANQFDMTARLERWKQDPKTLPFADPAGYKAYIDQYQKEFDTQLAKEQAGGAPYAVSPPPLPPCPQDGRKCYGFN
jgi:metallo-beta-lactamase class B